MQKYRADKSEPQSDGATLWFAQWIGGPSLAKIENCRLDGLAGDMRRTVYVTREPDTYFSQPAMTRIAGCRVRGYITSHDGALVFQHCFY